MLLYLMDWKLPINKGYKKALRENKALAKGLNIIDGKITYEPVAKSFNLKYYPIEEVIG